MMYERFGGRPIAPDINKITSSLSIPVIGFGDVLAALIDYPDLSIGEKIYHYMIEIKYKNNVTRLASWLKKYEDVYGTFEPLDVDEYDKFKIAYNEAYKLYGLNAVKIMIFNI